MAETFPEVFVALVEASASAPGSVNLLGTHTDYSHGFVLAISTPQITSVELAVSRDEMHNFHSVGMGGTVACSPDGEIPDGFAAYLFGCVKVLYDHGFPISPVSALVRSNVPVFAGLSSSSALQVAMMRALRKLFNFDLNDVSLARLAQLAEIEYAGVNCGIMEHLASSLGDAERMLFLDTRSPQRQLLPLPEDGEILVVDSGIPAARVDYTERRGECVEVCRRLAVAALRDVTDAGMLDSLHPLLRQRGRHVVTENARVLEAAGGVSARRFGELMNDSHASLRDDYQVSIPAIDALAEILRSDPRTYGARITGAGLGGACVALVEKGTARAVGGDVLERYKGRGGEGRLLIP